MRFETDDNNSYFLAHLDIHPEFLKELEAGTTPQATPKATPKALELLRVLKQGPKTRSEMMESMNLKDVMNFSRTISALHWRRNILQCNTQILPNIRIRNTI